MFYVENVENMDNFRVVTMHFVEARMQANRPVFARFLHEKGSKGSLSHALDRVAKHAACFLSSPYLVAWRNRKNPRDEAGKQHNPAPFLEFVLLRKLAALERQHQEACDKLEDQSLHLERVERHLEGAERRASDLEQALSDETRRAKQAEAQASEGEWRARQAESWLTQYEQRTKSAEAQVADLEQRVKVAEAGARKAEVRVSKRFGCVRSSRKKLGMRVRGVLVEGVFLASSDIDTDLIPFLELLAAVGVGNLRNEVAGDVVCVPFRRFWESSMQCLGIHANRSSQ